MARELERGRPEKRGDDPWHLHPSHPMAGTRIQHSLASPMNAGHLALSKAFQHGSLVELNSIMERPELPGAAHVRYVS